MEREELIDRILSVMRKKGAQAIRMNQLPIEAKVNSKVLKEHFATKEEVFEACIGKVLQNHRHATKKVEGDKTLNPIVKVARIYKKGLEELMYYHPSFFFHLKKRYRKLYDEIEAYNTSIFNVELPALLAEAKQQGIILKEINLELFCRTQLSQSQIIIENIYPQFYDQAEEVIKIQLLTLRGLLKPEHLPILDQELNLN